MADESFPAGAPRVARRLRAMDHPLYAGFTIATAGAALVAGSAAGLWIVTPSVAMACAAFVIGYERDATVRRFGVPPRKAFFHVPDGHTLSDRLSVLILVLLPWLVLYEAVEILGVPARTLTSVLPWDANVPLVPAFEAIYFLTYPFVIGAAFTKGNLREFAVSGWIATAAIILFYLIVPIIAPARPIPPTDALSRLLAWERTFDSPMTAFPAFHVVWACLAARCFARWWAWAFAALISVACVFTGMHAIVDIFAGVAAYGLVVRAPRVWRTLRRWSEAVAASWRDWRLGPVRVINHGLYAGAGALTGVPHSRDPHRPARGELRHRHSHHPRRRSVGAARRRLLWTAAPVRVLRRPPRRHRGVVISGISVGNPWLFLAALSVAAPFIQLLGRIRCLVQGCCHGRETDASIGIRYHHAHSRVVRAGLGGVPLHATQLYSILTALVTGAIEIRLWTLHAPLAFIAGVYLVLAGLTRLSRSTSEENRRRRWCGG